MKLTIVSTISLFLVALLAGHKVAGQNGTKGLPLRSSVGGGRSVPKTLLFGGLFDYGGELGTAPATSITSSTEYYVSTTTDPSTCVPKAASNGCNCGTSHAFVMSNNGSTEYLECVQLWADTSIFTITVNMVYNGTLAFDVRPSSTASIEIDSSSTSWIVLDTQVQDFSTSDTETVFSKSSALSFQVVITIGEDGRAKAFASNDVSVSIPTPSAPVPVAPMIPVPLPTVPVPTTSKPIMPVPLPTAPVPTTSEPIMPVLVRPVVPVTAPVNPPSCFVDGTECAFGTTCNLCCVESSLWPSKGNVRACGKDTCCIDQKCFSPSSRRVTAIDTITNNVSIANDENLQHSASVTASSTGHSSRVLESKLELSSICGKNYCPGTASDGCSIPLGFQPSNAFTPACNLHDICYACNHNPNINNTEIKQKWDQYDKLKCDNMFLDKMNAMCYLQFGTNSPIDAVNFFLQGCLTLASAYHVAVVTVGKDSFKMTNDGYVDYGCHWLPDDPQLNNVGDNLGFAPNYAGCKTEGSSGGYNGCWEDGRQCLININCKYCCNGDSFWVRFPPSQRCGRKEPCWEDGIACVPGFSCFKCCNTARDKEGFQCGGGCWSDGRACGEGTTCNFCCNGSRGLSACGGRACFPGDAVVFTPEGKNLISNVRVGDQVATAVSDEGELQFETVYFLGHDDPEAYSFFYRIEMVPNAVSTKSLIVEMTALHFLPVLVQSKFKKSAIWVNTRAKDVLVGDIILAYSHEDHHEKSLSLHTVVGVSILQKHGLFNPYTMSGKILVNNVSVSSHSDWILDPLFDVLGLTSWLPNVYQLLLLPLRVVFRLLGADLYVKTSIPSCLTSAVIGETSGQIGAITTSVFVVSTLLSLVTVRRFLKSGGQCIKE